MKLSDSFKSKFFIDRLALKETLEPLVKASSVRWFGHVMRKDQGNVLRKALTFKIDGSTKKGRPKVKWKKQNSFRNW